MNTNEFEKFANPADELHKGLWELSLEHYRATMKEEGSFLFAHKAFLEMAVDAFNFAEPYFRKMYQQKYKKEYEEKLKEKEIAFNAAKKALIDTIKAMKGE